MRPMPPPQNRHRAGLAAQAPSHAVRGWGRSVRGEA